MNDKGEPSGVSRRVFRFRGQVIVWPRKRYAVIFLLWIGLVSAFLGASGQDQRLPWPPRPVQPPDGPVTLDNTPPPVQQPEESYPPVPLPPSVTEPSTIVQVSAPAQEPMQNPTPPVLPDVPMPLPEPAPPAPPVKNAEPEAKVAPLPIPAPVVTLPDPEPKPAIPEVPIPKAQNIAVPNLPVTPPKDPILPPIIHEAPKPVKITAPPKTISIAPSQPAVQLKEQAPEPVRPPSFRVVAPIRKPTAALPDPPTLPPSSSIPRETFAPPLPTLGNPPPISGTQTPLLTFEKKGPASVQVNQAARFEIVLRNSGSIPAQKVQVEDEIPVGTRFMGGDPQPILRGDRVTWILDSLAPGMERRLMLDLQATTAADFGTNTTVTVSATKMGRTNVSQSANVSQPALSLSMKGPSGAAVGQPVVFEIEMANNGPRPVTNLVLQAIIPPGLLHALGDRIEADVNDLPPLTSKSFPLATTAAKPGRHTIQIKIISSDGREASAQAVVVVSQGGVGVRPAGTSRLMLDREGDIQIEVANYTNRTLRNVVVTDTMPEGLAFVDASDRGLYRASTRSVYWMVDSLAAGQTKTLTTKVRPHSSGEHSHQAIAKTEEGEIKLMAAIVVESLPNLQVKISGRDNPVEVGRQAVYEILVQNQGSGPATGVRVMAMVPEGMRPAAARGPTAYAMQGQQVVFEPLPRIEARKQMVFEIAALAQSPGDRRLRVQVTSDQVQAPITREERTWVFE